MKVLALDPAMVNTGVVIFDDLRVIHTQTIKNSSPLDGVAKWMSLQQNYAIELNSIIQEHQPGIVVSEYPHGFQSANAARGLSTVSGIISGLCMAHGIPLRFYTEYDVKKVLFGHSKGISKAEMMARVLGIFQRFSYIPLVKGKPPTVNSFQHVADALGVLTVYLKQEGIIH
jgi:Holliday junction resolvasome RuvABC endonuclease subunit